MKHAVKITFALVLSLLTFSAGGAPVILDITTSVTPVTCFNGSDGSITVTNVTPGTAPFTYVWFNNLGDTIPGETGPTLSGLTADYYTVHVWGSGPGPEFGQQGVSVPNGPNINFGLLLNYDVNCNGANDGLIFVSASSGSRSMEYSIDSGNTWQSSNTFPDLSPGNYYVKAQDDQGCSKFYAGNPVVIDEPTAISIDDTSSTPITCYGYDDATISVDASGGTAPLTYTLWPNGSVSNGDGEFSGVGPGSYSVEIEDGNGCTVTAETFTFTDPPQIQITKQTFTPITCNGDANGAISVDAIGGTGTLEYFLFPDGSVSNGDGEFSPLGPDTYYVRVEDDNGCFSNTNNFVLDDPSTIYVDTEDTTSITCYGKNDGKIEVTGAGGTPPYTYTLNPDAISNGTGLFEGIDPGLNYSVSVTDANGCPPDVSSSWDFTEPPAVTLSATDTNDVTCNGYTDGDLTVSAGGGSGSYTYTLSPGSVVQVNDGYFDNLAPDTYQVSVKDSKGCAGPTVTDLVVGDPPPITIDDTTVNDILCFGETNGEILVTASGGTGALAYTLDPGGIPSGTGNYTGLGANIYSVSVTDANSCPGDTAKNLVLNEPPVLGIASPQDTTSISCNGANDGRIQIEGTGGTPPYDYTLYKTPATYVDNNASGDFPDLAPSTPEKYYVTVTDVNNCTPVNSDSWEFTEPAAITLVGVDTIDVTCNGAGNGSLTVSASGGTPPYTYTLNPGAVSQSSPTFSGLSGGTYSVSVTDSRSCPGATVNDLVINDPAPISITFASKINITCNGDADGQIVILANGGTSPLKYILKDPVSPVDSNYTGTFSPLGGGTYSVDVTDTNRCGPANSGNLNLVNPLPITITKQDTTPITCNGDNNGKITITASGGTGTLSYTLTPGPVTQPSGLFTDITPGLGYRVTVTDANACPADTSDSWDFVEPDVITITPLDTSDVTCAGAGNGSLSVSAGGGTAPYTYTLTPGSVSQSSGDFNNLSGNTYSVSVTDSRSCPPASVGDMVVNEPSPIAISDIDTNDITCNGLNDGSIVVTAGGGTGTLYYTLTPGPINNTDGNFTNLAGNTYKLSITDDNGCGPVKDSGLVVIDPPAITIDKEDTAGITCNGSANAYIDIDASGGTGTLTYILKNPADVDTNDTGLFTDLGPGTYTVEVDDENACGPVTSNPFIFNDPPAIDVTVDGSSSKTLACYGDSTGTLNITVTGGFAPYTYAWTGPGGFTSTSKNISGLKAGDYNLTVTDSKGCNRIYAPLDSITGPDEFTMSVAINNITCFGDGDGSATITASGGTPPYEYSRLPLIWQGSNVFSPLNPGIYNFKTRDANSCEISQTDTVTQPLEIKITNETTDNSGQLCHGDSNGIITITATGGMAPLEYSIDTGKTYFLNNTFTGLGGGDYQIYVRDANGCTVVGGKPKIQNPPLLYISLYAQQDITTCFTSAEGQIVIEGGGGSPPLDYILDAADTNQTGIFSSVTQGTHDLRILDTKGCTADTSVVINSPPPITVSTIITDVTTCYEDSTGVVGIVATGGTGSVKGYIFLGDTTFSADTVYYDSLPGGSYDFTVIDSLGCEVYPSAVVNAPDSIGYDSLIVLQVTCFGDTDGEIRAYGAGGTPPYYYVLNPGADTNFTGVYTGLVPGDYTLTIGDKQGCRPYVSGTLSVIEPPQLVFDSSSVTTISCQGSGDGIISIFASGGTPPYSYSVDTGASYDTASVTGSLGPATYILMVRDASGCLAAGDTVTLADPPGLSLGPSTVTDVSTCAGDSNGIISVSASGGTGALEYSIDSLAWQGSGSFAGLPAGIYTVKVRDARGCTSGFPPDTVGEPPPISATISSSTALIPDPGSIVISASGGTPPLEYSIDSGASYSSDTLYLVPSEIYYVFIRDANGCIYEDVVYVSATPPLEVNVSSTSLNCYFDANGSISLSPVNGIGTMSYSIDGGASTQPTGDFTGLSGGDYFVEVRDSQRVFRDTVVLTEPPPYDVTASVTPATCSRNSFDGAVSLTVSGATPPYTFLWSNDSTSEDISGLEEGTFRVSITDQNGCQYTDSFEITAYVSLRADAGPDTTVCYGETVTLNGSGGDEFTWSPEEGLDRIDVADPTTVVTDSVSYILFTRDQSSGCTDRDTVTLKVHPDRGISAGQDTTIAPGQTITLVAAGGTFTSYLWEPSEGLDNPNSQSTTATVSSEIGYSVTGTTEFGCQETDSMRIYIATGLKIYSGFTPNGDGVNDVWEIDDIVYYPNATVKVFDRWGKTVFSSVGYADEQRWDGKYKGKDLPIGTYYYVIDLKDGSEPYRGPVTIVR